MPEINSYFKSVKKRDNSLEQFDPKKIYLSLENALKDCKQKNNCDLKAIVETVLKVLERNYLPGETITTENIKGAVWETLLAMHCEELFENYQNYQARKERLRQYLKVAKRQKQTDVTDFTLLVQSEANAEVSVWNKRKIVDALIREANLSYFDAYRVASNVEKRVLSLGLESITTSLIREIVDNELLQLGYSTKVKQQISIGIPVYNLQAIIFSKNLENSNIAAHNPEAINLAIAETTLKQYALNKVFSERTARAHLEGRIHIHDLGYPTRVYCSGHSLEYIKKYGLMLENLEIVSKPAKHARTLTGHLNTFLASMQAYYAGALGIGYINIFYAPYLVGLSYREILQEAQYLLFSLSQSAFSRGGQTLFLDANIHTGVPDYLRDVPAIGPGGEYTGKTYGDYENEAQCFAKALLDVYRDGDAFHRVFAFPKCDLHIDEKTFTDKKQRQLLEYACLVASENGTPYFIFDRGGAATLSACCRLRTKITDPYMIKHPESLRFCGFQNVTINLPQAAYRAKRNNIDKLYEEISRAMDIAVQAHFEKKEFIAKLMEKRGLPLWQVGKVAQDGRPYIELDKSTYIIGIIGLNECVQFLTGKQLHEDEDAYRLGLKIISFMYLKVKEYEKKYGLKFSLEESPAESATRRLSKVDLQTFPESKEVIKGDIQNEEFYYTNSIHFAPDAPISLVERIEKQSRFHQLIESGAIIHAFIGEEKPDPSAILKLVERTYRNTQCAQITISPEFTICNSCHRNMRGLKDRCLACGSTDVYGITRIVGYFSRVSNWNKSKLGELRDRKSGNYSVRESNHDCKSLPTEKKSEIARIPA